MIHLRPALLAALCTLLMFGTVLYTSCKKQSQCAGNKCRNGGACVDGQCKCPEGFTGSFCETDLCQNIICHHGGSCKNGKCNCAGFYFGPYCDSNPCDTIHCLNGGYCSSGGCNCPVGTGGRNCEIFLRDVFIGTYQRMDSCSNVEEDTVAITISAMPDISKVAIRYTTNTTVINFIGTAYGKDSLVVGAANFTPDVDMFGSIILQGNNTLRFKYMLIHRYEEGSSTSHCAMTLIRQ